jgi:NADPH:quinone reductase
MEVAMLSMRAKSFDGYDALQPVDEPKPERAEGRVLVKMTAAGVTPLEHTILFGKLPRAKAPLVLGNEGAGVVEDPGRSGFATGTRVMFTGPYGVREDGSWREYVAARPEDLSIIPAGIDDVTAASLPVAYLTGQLSLAAAGFSTGKSVLAPAIGGSVGNAVYQLARAQGAGKAISTTTSAAKAQRARELGYEDVIDLSSESLAEGIGRITSGKGVDIVIESVGGDLTGQALAGLALGGVLITLGYSAGRRTSIDVTDLIWKGARMAGFSLFAQSPIAIADAWTTIRALLTSGAVKPIVARTFRLREAAEALRYLIDERPFGKIVLAG